MLLIKFAGLPIAHLWLNPDAKLDAVFFCRFNQGLQSSGQLAGVDVPVAKGCIVAVAVEFLTGKPAVVHHEELATNIGCAFHEFQHLLFIHGQIYALPTVEQDVTQRRAVVHLEMAGPIMKITAHTTTAFGTIGESQFGRTERRTRLQIIRQCVINACHKPVFVWALRV